MDNIFDNLKDSFNDLNKLKSSLLSSSINGLNELEKIKSSNDMPENLKKDLDEHLAKAQKKINELKDLTNGN